MAPTECAHPSRVSTYCKAVLQITGHTEQLLRRVLTNFEITGWALFLLASAASRTSHHDRSTGPLPENFVLKHSEEHSQVPSGCRHPREGNTPSAAARPAQGLGNFGSGAAARVRGALRSAGPHPPARRPVHARRSRRPGAPQPRLRSPPRRPARGPSAGGRPCPRPLRRFSSSSAASFPSGEWVTRPLRS